MRPDHTLKSWRQFFQAIKSGDKKHDMRDLRDRTFKIGDICLLREYDQFEGRYTGEELLVRITYITSRDTPCAFSSRDLARDAAILSFEVVNEAGEAGKTLWEHWTRGPILNAVPYRAAPAGEPYVFTPGDLPIPPTGRIDLVSYDLPSDVLALETGGATTGAA